MDYITLPSTAVLIAIGLTTVVFAATMSYFTIFPSKSFKNKPNLGQKQQEVSHEYSIPGLWARLTATPPISFSSLDSLFTGAYPPPDRIPADLDLAYWYYHQHRTDISAAIWFWTRVLGFHAFLIRENSSNCPVMSICSPEESQALIEIYNQFFIPADCQLPLFPMNSIRRVCVLENPTLNHVCFAFQFSNDIITNSVATTHTDLLFVSQGRLSSTKADITSRNVYRQALRVVVADPTRTGGQPAVSRCSQCSLAKPLIRYHNPSLPQMFFQWQQSRKLYDLHQISQALADCDQFQTWQTWYQTNANYTTLCWTCALAHHWVSVKAQLEANTRYYHG